MKPDYELAAVKAMEILIQNKIGLPKMDSP